MSLLALQKKRRLLATSLRGKLYGTFADLSKRKAEQWGMLYTMSDEIGIFGPVSRRTFNRFNEARMRWEIK